jgi:ABC-type transporter MlaC component
MPSDEFWRIISQTVGPGFDPDAQANALRSALRELSLGQITSFEVAFRRYLNQAYTWDLWGAAYVIHGGYVGV